MSNKKKYLEIEKIIFNSLGKIGYVTIFFLVFLSFMVCVDFFLYCFVDNFYSSKFLFTGEISFNSWFHLMRESYSFSIFKMILFGVIFLAVGIYRVKRLNELLS